MTESVIPFLLLVIFIILGVGLWSLATIEKKNREIQDMYIESTLKNIELLYLSTFKAQKINIVKMARTSGF